MVKIKNAFHVEIMFFCHKLEKNNAKSSYNALILQRWITG